MSQETITIREVNREGWPAGPWDSEPDDVRWRTEVGLPAIMLRNTASGHWCGYVGVAPGHPTYEKTYWDEATASLEVHGGLTYNDRCDPALGVCHVPLPGESDDFWWHGFDMHHSEDYAPGYAMRQAEYRRKYGGIALSDEDPAGYRTASYVRQECESLARQLVALSPEKD